MWGTAMKRRFALVLLLLSVTFGAAVFFFANGRSNDSNRPIRPEKVEEANYSFVETGPAPEPEHIARAAIRAEGDAILRGRVLALDGQPVPNAAIRIVAKTTTWNHEGGRVGEETRLQSDPTGAFDASPLPFGHYLVIASHEEGYASEAVRLTRRISQEDVLLVLHPGETIAGLVRSTDGTAIGGAEVFPVAFNGTLVPRAKMAASMVTTDSDGRFAMGGLAAGRWILVAKAKDYAPAESAEQVTGSDSCEIILDAGAPVRGTAIDTVTNLPIPNLVVSALPIGTHIPKETISTDDNGQFMFDHLPQVSCEIGVDDESYLLLEGLPLVMPAEPAPDITLRLTKGGEVRGRVYEVASGEGVSEVRISAEIRSAIGTFQFQTQQRKPGEPEIPLRTPSTLPDGTFSITGLAPGMYHISASSFVPGFGSTRQRDMETDVQLNPGDVIEGIEFAIDRGIVMSGLVVDVDGKPVPGSRVNCWYLEKVSRRSQVANADNAGRFVFTEMRPDHEVTVWAEAGSTESEKIGPLMIPAGGLHEVKIVMTATKDAKISGTVVNQQGKPVEVTVTGLEQTELPNPKRFTTQSASDGRFLVPNVSAGVYDVSLNAGRNEKRPAGEVTVNPGQFVRDVRLVFEEQPLYTIEGHVSDESGNPLEAYVSYNRVVESTATNLGGVRSGSDGSFRIEGLEQGAYSIHADCAGFASEATMVNAGDSGIQIVLRPLTGTLAGRVVDVQGHAVPAFRIALFRDSDYRGVSSAPKNIVDQAGSFEMQVREGTYRIEVQADGYLAEEKDAVEVATGQRSTATFTLRPGDAEVRGTIVDAAGQPVVSAKIFTQRQQENGELGTSSAAARSDAEGRFTLHAVPDKPLAISATHPSAGSGSAMVTPRSNAPQSVTIALAALGKVTGAIRVQGNPLTGGTVLLCRGGIALSSEYTKAGGLYEFDQVEAGRYDIVAYPGFISQSYQDAPAPLSRTAEIVDGAVTVVDFDF
ncbi:MAG: hypothetical protein AMXMBFR84_15110 [Candidatus Hydrogenedentota bacterium]